VLTGDSFPSSAGRPDLLGEKHTTQLAEQQFHTLRRFHLKLPITDIYPNHGAGSVELNRSAIEQHDRLRAKI
jgi:hydroxyacylglutathione hydrolase